MRQITLSHVVALGKETIFFNLGNKISALNKVCISLLWQQQKRTDTSKSNKENNWIKVVG